MSFGPIRVLLADDHTIVRQSLKAVIDASGDLRVVAEAADGLDTLEKALQYRPDVAVVDISMPRLSGIEVVRRLKLELPNTRTLVLTMHEENEYLLRAVSVGASGFLLKDQPTSELLKAIRTVHAGRSFFSPDAAKVLADPQQPRNPVDDPYGTLTVREREIFHSMVEGKTSKEIARILKISVKTAENHRAHIMEKLNTRNIAEVIRYAARKGLID